MTCARREAWPSSCVGGLCKYVEETRTLTGMLTSSPWSASTSIFSPYRLLITQTCDAPRLCASQGQRVLHKLRLIAVSGQFKGRKLGFICVLFIAALGFCCNELKRVVQPVWCVHGLLVQHRAMQLTADLLTVDFYLAGAPGSSESDLCSRFTSQDSAR